MLAGHVLHLHPCKVLCTHSSTGHTESWVVPLVGLPNVLSSKVWTFCREHSC